MPGIAPFQTVVVKRIVKEKSSELIFEVLRVSRNLPAIFQIGMFGEYKIVII